MGADIDDSGKMSFRWNRMNRGAFFLAIEYRAAIIKDLPKPVKKAGDPQRSNFYRCYFAFCCGF
jgi:hypothetical protein